MRASDPMRFAVCLACLVAAAPAFADGWSLSNLVPFKEETKEYSGYTPAPGFDADDEEPPTSGFKLPKPKLPQLPKMTFGQSSPSQPSTMQKLSRGTKNFFSKTADALTPWDNDEKTAPRARTATGVRRTYNGSPSAAPEPKKSSFLPSWLTNDDDPDPPQTVNGFIAQPRPRF